MQVFKTMVQSRVELTITTFGILLIAGAHAHDYALVQEVCTSNLYVLFPISPYLQFLHGP